ncbi:hypothetical protein ZONE111905_11475 [Zobellia nedashkovskayae]
MVKITLDYKETTTIVVKVHLVVVWTFYVFSFYNMYLPVLNYNFRHGLKE